MRTGRVFYGWYIVIGGMIVALLQGAFYVYGFSVFYVPLVQSLGSSRAALGGVIGLSRLEGGLIAPVAGWLIDQYGPRRLMFFGLGVMGLGFFVFSQINALWQLYAIFLVMSLGASLGSSRPVTVAVANWFIRRRGLATGLLYAGFGLGGSFSFALAWCIDQFGWQTSAMIGGVLFIVIGYPVAFMMRHRPEDMGLLPDGDTIDESANDGMIESGTVSESSTSVINEVEMTPRQAMSTLAFWMLALAYAAWASVVTVVTVYQIPFLQEEVGVSLTTAAGVASFFPFLSIIGRVGFGITADKVNVRYILPVLFLGQAVGLSLLAMLPSISWAPLYLVVFSLSYGGSIPLRTVIVANFYGRKNFGTISGLLQFVDLPGTALAPFFVGWVFDSVGSYRPGFFIIAAMTLIGAFALIFARAPKITSQHTARDFDG